MTRWVLNNWVDRYDEILVVFANTGQENEKTLEFVDKCDLFFGFNTVWLEAEIDPRVGTVWIYFWTLWVISMNFTTTR